MQCQNNLRQIGQGLLAYQDFHGQLPSRYSTDARGFPRHSWRAAILPYLDHLPLYQELDLSAAWDAAANQRSVIRRPHFYQCPSFSHHASHQGQPHDKDGTQFLSLVSSRGILRVPNSRKLGDNNLLRALVADTPYSVPWLAPRDVRLQDLSRDLIHLPSEELQHPGGSLVLWNDLSVQFVPRDTSLEEVSIHAQAPTQSDPQ